MITPTIGRVVWYYPPGMPHTGEPWPALITRVWDDHLIGVGGFNKDGDPFKNTSVDLLQDASSYGNPSGGPWCCWMPYQHGQAAKAEALQAKLEGAPVKS